MQKLFFFSILMISIQSLAINDLTCFEMKRGSSHQPNDFILESSSIKNGKIYKKIYMNQNGLISKKEVTSNTDFTSKKRKKVFIADEFLFDFILSKKIAPDKTYEVETQDGTALFKIKNIEPPRSELNIETPKGALVVKILNQGHENKIKEIFFRKSNLTLLPCRLDTQLEIFKNKDVNLFIGDQVAQVIHK